jgi:hypothetical protein
MAEQPKIARVSIVDHVNIGEHGGQVVVSASGHVNSSHWGAASLSAWAYIDTPKDGIQDFDLVAEPPSGFVLWVQTPISATLSAPKPSWLKGVRVHAATNSVEAMIGDADRTFGVRVVSSDEDTLPWPW